MQEGACKRLLYREVPLYRHYNHYYDHWFKLRLLQFRTEESVLDRPDIGWVDMTAPTNNLGT